MSDSNSPRVLITGGAGYLGSILTEHLLDAGHHVCVLDNLLYGQNSMFHLCANPNFEFVYGDARDERILSNLISKADVIIPLAAIVGAPACDRVPDMTVTVNFEAIRTLNNIRSSSQLVIYPTTNSGYGTKSGDVFCTEDTPLEPISLYGRTKVDAELLLLDSENTITLRLATVFGTSPRMRLDLMVNDFTHKAFSDGYIVIFEKDFKRNFVHIRDVADCFKFCIKNSDKMIGRAYNMGNDSANISKEQLALKIKEHVPNFFIHFAEVGSDPDKRNYLVSNQRIKEAGFEAKRSLDDGIEELLKAFKMLGRNPLGNV